MPVLMALPRCLNSLFASPVVTRTTRDSLCWRTPKLMRLSRLGALGGVPSAMASEFEIDESTRALGGQMLRRPTRPRFPRADRPPPTTRAARRALRTPRSRERPESRCSLRAPRAPRDAVVAARSPRARHRVTINPANLLKRHARGDVVNDARADSNRESESRRFVTRRFRWTLEAASVWGAPETAIWGANVARRCLNALDDSAPLSG